LAVRLHRLAVGNLRLALGCLDSEFSVQSIHDDLEVELTHSGNDRLARLSVCEDSESRVFLRQSEQGSTELLLVGLRLRLDGDLDNRLGELDSLQRDVVMGVAHRLSRIDVVQTDDAYDVACEHFVDVVSAVSV